jgi:hypothetical protein
MSDSALSCWREPRYHPAADWHVEAEMVFHMYEDFLTGLLVSNDAVWGRPVGIAVAGDGSLLVSEDGNATIWRITWIVGSGDDAVLWRLCITVDQSRAWASIFRFSFFRVSIVTSVSALSVASLVGSVASLVGHSTTIFSPCYPAFTIARCTLLRSRLLVRAAMPAQHGSENRSRVATSGFNPQFRLAIFGGRIDVIGLRDLLVGRTVRNRVCRLRRRGRRSASRHLTLGLGPQPGRSVR